MPAPDVCNRIECQTAFDFTQVRELLVSAPVACPVKEGYSFVTVVLFTENRSLPIIVPYLYTAGRKNSLQRWKLVNAKLQEAEIVVAGFDVVRS